MKSADSVLRRLLKVTRGSVMEADNLECDISKLS